MIVYHDVEAMLDFAEKRIGNNTLFNDDARPIGWQRNGELAAVAVFYRFRPWECEVAFAVGQRRWFASAFAYAAFAFPFIQLELERMTCDVAASDKPARALARMLGFAREGRKRRLIPENDRLIYGLLRSECRWLPPLARAV